MTRALSSTLPHRKTFRLAWRIKPTTSQDCIHQRPHLYSHFSKTPRFFPIQSMKTTLLQRNVLEMSRGGHVDSVDATESNITCCSNGGCCRTGQFCIKHGPGCCYDNDRECDDGGCCPTGTYCVSGGCCPNGSVCTNGPGIITLANTLIPISQTSSNHSHGTQHHHHHDSYDSTIVTPTFSYRPSSIASPEGTTSAVHASLSDTILSSATAAPPSSKTLPSAQATNIPTLYIPSSASITNLANWSYSTTDSPFLPLPPTNKANRSLTSNNGDYLPFYALVLILFLQHVI